MRSHSFGQAGKIARLFVVTIICLAALLGCLQTAFAAVVPSVSISASSGATLKDTIKFSDTRYIYIVEVPASTKSITATIQNSEIELKNTATEYISNGNGGFTARPLTDCKVTGNDFTFSVANASYGTPIEQMLPSLVNKPAFAKWKTGYSFYVVLASSKEYEDPVLLEDIQYTYYFLCYQQATESVDKTTLKSALDAVPTSGYYTADDRYNGKTESKTGFWNEMQRVVTAAKTIYESSAANQAAVDAAAKTLDQGDPNSELSKAIANLIPTSQVNPTGLHETLPLYSDLEEKGYSTDSWAAFYRKRTDAQNLYDSLFTKDAEGNVTATEENSSAKHPQKAVDALVKELQDAATNLQTRVCSTQKAGSENALAGIALYAGYYDTLKEADYTPESWQAYRSARADALNTAKEHGLFTSTMGTDEIALQSQAFNKVRKAYFSLVPKAKTITVRVSLTDELSAKQPADIHHRVIPRTQKLTVPTGTTIGDLLTTSFKNENRWKINSMSQLMVYVNGTLAFGSGSGEYFLDYPQAGEYWAFKLHDGDEVTVVRVKMPTMVNISEDLWPMALGRVTDKIRYQTLTTDLQKDETTGAYKAVVGVPFTLTATSKAAMPAHMTDDEAKPTAGAYVFRSMIVDDYELAVKAEILTDTKLKTGADGTLTMTAYQPGWQLINVYNLDSDDAAFVNGGAILIYAEVDESQADLTKIKNDLRAELKKTYENPDYPKECFTEADWQTIETLYKTGMEGIDAAKDAASAYAAQLTAKSGIEALQTKAAKTNADNLANFRAQMAKFPEDLSKLDSSAVQLIDQLEAYYNAMTQYQRDELSVKEKTRYEAILAARDGLSSAKDYTVNVEYDLTGVPEADRAGLKAMIKALQDHTTRDGFVNGVNGDTMMAKLYSFNYASGATMNKGPDFTELTTADPLRTVEFCFRPYYAVYMNMRADRTNDKNGRKITGDTKTLFPLTLNGDPFVIGSTEDGWSIEDARARDPESWTGDGDGLIFRVNGNEYEMRGVTFSGIDENSIVTRGYDVFDASDYMGRTSTVLADRIRYSFYEFTMPYDNVTATVTWVPVGGSESEITAAKDSAKTALKTALDGYGKDHTQYAAILEAYNEGLTAINSAKTVEQVAAERREALKNMANAANDVNTGALIKGWEYDEGEYWELTGFDPGPQIGTVTVSVQNYTNDGSSAEGENKAALEHFYRPEDQYWLERKNYPLGQNDTMMTVLLRALTEKKCTWLGTGGNGDEKYDFDITYLSTITDGDYSLAEFTGGQQSGWMGTLNDWFTNEGFANFTVENGKLADGDIISIKYTSVGLGEDVGGTWSNSDTTLKSLTFDGDGSPRLATTFEPGKRGGTYTYTLVIDGDSSNLTVTPTAANKNFLVKTFLNEKVTSNTEGSSFYKRTESIPVVAGDTIYIGCGIKGWPTMNNQAGNTQSNDGTWYVVRVLSASGSYKVVEDQLKQLPQADTIDFTNYEKYEKQIAAAEAAYKQLQSEQQAKVNKDAVENLEKLLEKVQSYRKLKEFKATVKSLPRPAEATLDDVEEIRSAQRTYEEIKKNSDLYESLSVAETRKMDELIEAADTLIWNDAVEKINAIGTVTINSGDAINAAKAAVSRLSADQLKTFPQELLDKLAEAERIYHLLTEGGDTPVLPVTPSKPKDDKPTTGSSFTDVPAGSWYEEAVNYVHEKGLMNGTSSNAFSPNANTTRGMIVTILARVEGVNTNGTPWYAAGQKWAMDNGISDGTNMPGVITREQLATILYRNAKQKGYDVSKSAALTAFSDADKVSGYAAEAMQWAVAEGLLQGSNGKLNPQGSATRAQVATILMRFMEKIEK